MNRISLIAAVALLVVSFGFGQDAAQVPPRSLTPNAVGHGAFPVKVIKTLDSSKLKEGDAVEVETAGTFKLPDGTLVPKGSKLTGHVTSAKARSKGDPESQLAVSFDKLNVTNGKQLSVKGTVQAVFPPPDEVDPGVPSASSHQGGNGAGLTAGGAVPAPDYKPTTDIKIGSDTESRGGQAVIDPKSVGVHGMDNLQLNDGVLTAKGKNVKLGGGVRMIVRADIY